MMDHTAKIPVEVIQMLSADQAWSYRVIPLETNQEYIKFVVEESNASNALKDELELLFGKEIKWHYTAKADFDRLLNKHYRVSNKRTAQNVSLGQSDDFLVNLIKEANDLSSSDIHIEQYEQKCRIRIRLDGKLIEKYVLDKEDYPALVNKIKIKGHLDISEKRLPQDGRITFNEDGMHFDIRVSVLPTLYGEKIVMRLLSKDATDIRLEELGFTPSQLDEYMVGVKKSNGIILISGPTGSGKTTTLYATLKTLNAEQSNILTIEDPIEYTLEGINQVQLKESIGLSFAAALRTFLRQDPDIIMLGEIRDAETAQMAIRAALTGHLVLSTIHTNSSWGTISRLIDMGVPSYLVASTINVSLAQRLVRLLCPHCKKQEDLKSHEIPPGFGPGEPLDNHHVAVGCEQCYYTGYSGRKAIYELLPMTAELTEMIKQQSFDQSLKHVIKDFKSLSDFAFDLLRAGQTSLEEVYPILISN